MLVYQIYMFECIRLDQQLLCFILRTLKQICVFIGNIVEYEYKVFPTIKYLFKLINIGTRHVNYGGRYVFGFFVYYYVQYVLEKLGAGGLGQIFFCRGFWWIECFTLSQLIILLRDDVFTKFLIDLCNQEYCLIFQLQVVVISWWLFAKVVFDHQHLLLFLGFVRNQDTISLDKKKKNLEQIFVEINGYDAVSKVQGAFSCQFGSSYAF
eukprot:TRINITY_DN14040_c1_g1_i1.p1 TRINITY_DN14040_c1_g1~~TRINITY_DN14040_c1_g1_i1.p1  ORF type:complete len:209 (+),score=0.88 TRINITY_DN14040_c1_g1_i1:361-987(+)